MKDLIIGCFFDYSWDTVQYWANSVNNCGFTGDRAVMVHNSDNMTIDYFRALGFSVCLFDPEEIAEGYAYPFSCAENYAHRFQMYYEYMNNIPLDDYRYVITTDVRDAIFQSNPSIWLEKNLGDKQLCASSEGLIYRNEPWSDTSMRNAYPRLYGRMESRPIYCCGVQAGDIRVMKDFWLQLALACAAGREAADQSAYNVLLSLRPWSEMTLFTTGEDGWACNAGTTAWREGNEFLPYLLEPVPTWDGTFVCTSTGQRHVIVHEFDRVPAWIETVKCRYGSPK